MNPLWRNKRNQTIGQRQHATIAIHLLSLPLSSFIQKTKTDQRHCTKQPQSMLTSMHFSAAAFPGPPEHPEPITNMTTHRPSRRSRWWNWRQRWCSCRQKRCQWAQTPRTLQKFVAPLPMSTTSKTISLCWCWQWWSRWRWWLQKPRRLCFFPTPRHCLYLQPHNTTDAICCPCHWRHWRRLPHDDAMETDDDEVDEDDTNDRENDELW